MTVICVEVLSACVFCGGSVRVHRDLASGRQIITNAHEDAGSVHECAEMAAETIVVSLTDIHCPECGSPDVARTSLGRMVEWFWGGPVPPYLDHVCVQDGIRVKETDRPPALAPSSLDDLRNVLG